MYVDQWQLFLLRLGDQLNLPIAELFKGLIDGCSLQVHSFILPDDGDSHLACYVRA